MAKLLREFISLDYDRKQIVEAKEKGGPITIPAILQRADEKNQNRSYISKIYFRKRN